jgi:hypothetical protein
MDNIGIYKLYFQEEPTKVYIGASTNLVKRLKDHYSACSRLDHPNKRIQEILDKNTGYTLRHEIIEYCTEEELDRLESVYIDKYNSYYSGYNQNKGGVAGVLGEKNAAAAKHSVEEYYEVLKLLANTNKSLAEIAELTGISIYIIKHISSGKTHTYLNDFYPAEYEKLKKKFSTRNNSAEYKGIVYPEVVSPSGEVFSVKNIHQFAKEHGLQYQNLHKVLTKQRKTHLGWTLK